MADPLGGLLKRTRTGTAAVVPHVVALEEIFERLGYPVLTLIERCGREGIATTPDCFGRIGVHEPGAFALIESMRQEPAADPTTLQIQRIEAAQRADWADFQRGRLVFNSRTQRHERATQRPGDGTPEPEEEIL